MTTIEILREKVDPARAWSLISAALPEQGCVEVQRDQAGKEHAWHMHGTDETIVVLDGSLRFYWEDGEEICGPGDVIRLPSGARHGSIALDTGAIYMIAMRDVEL
ncbi:cupin domain-containing protein [Salinarimonas sp. NSM]|uniref:cupin domain-containing protein n=1 Tax=Salinarimonas sp. NSM TaxID=3458003 RepID=UPI004035C56E